MHNPEENARRTAADTAESLAQQLITGRVSLEETAHMATQTYGVNQAYWVEHFSQILVNHGVTHSYTVELRFKVRASNQEHAEHLAKAEADSLSRHVQKVTVSVAPEAHPNSGQKLESGAPETARREVAAPQIGAPADGAPADDTPAQPLSVTTQLINWALEHAGSSSGAEEAITTIHAITYPQGPAAGPVRGNFVPEVGSSTGTMACGTFESPETGRVPAFFSYVTVRRDMRAHHLRQEGRIQVWDPAVERTLMEMRVTGSTQSAAEVNIQRQAQNSNELPDARELMQRHKLKASDRNRAVENSNWQRVGADVLEAHAQEKTAVRVRYHLLPATVRRLTEQGYRVLNHAEEHGVSLGNDWEISFGAQGSEGR